MREDTVETGSDAPAGLPHPRERTELVGHDEAEAAFSAAIGSGRLHHAWLIGGPKGIGKATLAFRVARRLLARAPVPGEGLAVAPSEPATRQVAALSHPNLVLLARLRTPDRKAMPAQIGVEAARRALALFGTTSANGLHRICIVDSAEELTLPAANALLKVLEEPPPRSLFLIVSHAPGRLLPTIRSRCRRLLLRPLSEPDLGRVLDGAGSLPHGDDAALRARAVSLAEGSVTRALGLLDPRVIGIVDAVRALLAPRAAPDWPRITALADQVAGREADDLFAAVLDTVPRVVEETLAREPGASLARLAALVEVCDKLAAAAREAATYNLDRRPLLLTFFGEIAALDRPAAA